MIYFIRAGKSGPVKIGYTDRPIEKRLADLQTSSAADLTLLCVMDGGRDLEREMHERFAGLRLRGEWFQPGRELMRYIRAEAELYARIINLRLSPDQMDAVREAARKIGLSVSAFIRMAVLKETRRELEGRD